MLTTPPLPPKTIAALHALGIRTRDDLCTAGSVRAFLLLKASGITVTERTLWQLEAQCLGITPHEMPSETKQQLRFILKNHPPVAVFPPQNEMETFMRLALEQAEQSAQQGEIPVGAVVVHGQNILAAAHNSCIADCDISRHAEINALAQAGKALQNYRLEDCDVYITLEPCTMCASALIQARVRRVIYGAAEPKTGAAGSIVDLFAHTALNRHTAILGGILQTECTDLLTRFFQTKRNGTHRL